MLFVTITGLLSVVTVCTGTGNGLPPVLDITLLEAGDSRCQADLTALRQALGKKQLWAQRMVDASVKSPVGLLSQTAVQFGDFDECLSTLHLSPAPISPQYCLVEVSSSNGNSSWSKFLWAVCLPASCSSSQLTSSLQAYMNSSTDSVQVEVDVAPRACTTRESEHSTMSIDDYIYCGVMAGILIIVLICTIFDVCKESTDETSSPPKSILQCLSARYCYLRLCKRDKQVPGVDTNILYGLHAIAIFFVVLGHRFAVHLFFMSLTNYSDVEEMFSDSWFSIWSCHMDAFVELFFFMSSFNLGLFYYGELHKRFVHPFLVYIKRIVRLLPICAVVVFFYATLLRHLTSGPMWNGFIEEEERNCYEYWWANLLFINTYVTPNNMCIPQSWFVSCDFQLFVIATLIIILFYHMPRLGAVVIFLLFIVSTVIPFTFTYIHDLPGMMLFLKDFWVDPRHHRVFSTVYSQAHFRGTSYLVGLVTGICVYKRRNKPISKLMTWNLQTAGVVICLLVYWSGSWFYNHQHVPSRLAAATYAATFHTAFGLAFALFVTSCALGVPTSISKFLSWNGFIAISKLSYTVYMIHVIPQLVWIGSSRTTVYLNPLELLSWSIADFILCLLAAFILNITVEMPTRYMFTYVMKAKTSDLKERDAGMGANQ